MISVLFYGTPEIAAISLAALLKEKDIRVGCVVTQPDRPTGRKQVLTPSPVKALALENNIHVVQPERIKRSERDFIATINRIGKFDIAVVVAFGQILPEAVLTIPRCGSLNLHASLLPRWRGAAPIQRAVMAGDLETGVCLMQMDAGLDTGAVYASTKIDILPHDTSSSVHDAIAHAGARLICKKLSDIVSGSLRAVPQSNEGVTYAQKITDADSLIDWNNSAEAISCQIRGLSPRPGAFTYIDGKRLKLFSPSAEIKPENETAPGVIASVAADSITIGCGSGALTIREAQIEGKKQMPIAEFLKGNPLTPGTAFKPLP